MLGEHKTLERPSRTAATGVTATGVQLGELDMPAIHESVPRARAFIRSLASVQGIPHVRNEAEILVSELVTNAVQHAATLRCTLRLVVLRAGTCLRIEVHDPSYVMPRIKRIDLLDETGRGWFLVAVIADRHGTELTDSGKSVWCELGAWPQAEKTAS